MTSHSVPHSGPSRVELDRKVEALLFVSPAPVEEREMASFLGVSSREVREAIGRLRERYQSCHGLDLIQVAEGWQMVTAHDLADLVGAFREVSQSQRVRLSRAAVETLAAVAYHQPITRAEIEEIRGVRCDRVLDTLLRHGLVRVAGRKRSPGNPLLYRTTSRFMDVFGLSSLGDLPSLEDLMEEMGNDDLEDEGLEA
ncbi:chromosome segregation and condensation protein, ScpB [Thermanaerovibrio acidaminovorans DSM 6589]|uniref:Chromosome segregation and condensation protein, ScpB n=1 Tax=Thermanaerovibrio acidaminovorans (strain ATCC 49978 / DSM 6589 / Su883) TaxID=525903 RepID=D1B9Q7_THEAS|nr:SMC-Scp complex subunit ScpB [Thermanaerovibrio acidaminovorans]ACZ19010.1 chromosome segregation and condensation protein, ScpB [Thermanaerovibrio acidaminovorans DSM 6589]